MKAFLKQACIVAIRLALAAVIVGTIVIVARISSPDKPVIIHSGALIITAISVTDHDSGNICNYTLSQKDENDKVTKKFSYITRCGMWNAADHLMIVQGKK
jgi:hypothetical protein